MIKKLKFKFVLLSMTTLVLLLTVILVGMNLINYNSIVEEADQTLDFLSQNKGSFPDTNNKPNEKPSGRPDESIGEEASSDNLDESIGEETSSDKSDESIGEETSSDNLDENNQENSAPSDKPQEERPPDKLPPHMSPETPYESRYFWVLTDSQGNMQGVNTERISSVDDTSALDYLQTALKQGTKRGFVGDFRYIAKEEPSGTRITFLDCSRTLSAFQSFLHTSICMALAGLAAVFVIIFILSGRIIKPIAESYEKQKQFITDAGHEIKTPLTIINANADILEMELGGSNESLSDIKSQTQRLRSLTDDLVMLTRMEEGGNKMPMIDFPLSEVVTDSLHPFYTLAQTQGKSIKASIQPLLSLKGNGKAIAQLVSLLLDNALKYSAPESQIELTLSKQGHSIVLCVSNAVEERISPQHLERIFDRCYRADTSRNSETGGHGIGLSVAKAIVTSHGGKISASAPKPNTFQITASFQGDKLKK